MAESDRRPDPPQPPAPGLAEEAVARRRRRDLAAVLPLTGLVLLASPLINTVADVGRIAGIPASVLYVFGVWLGLIVASAWLARRLFDDSRGED